MMKTAKSRVQQGFSLIELIIVLAIIGALSFGVYALYGTTSAQQRIQTETQSLNTLVQLVRGTFATQGTYTGLANAVVTPSGSFPDNLKVVGDPTLIKSSWADDGITLAPATVNATDDSFTITYNGGYTAGQCIDFVSKVYSYFDTATVEGVVVAGIPDVNANCIDDAAIVFTTQ